MNFLNAWQSKEYLGLQSKQLHLKTEQFNPGDSWK